MADCELPPPPPPDLATVIEAARDSTPLELKAREFLTALLQLCRDYDISIAHTESHFELVPWTPPDEMRLASAKDWR